MPDTWRQDILRSRVFSQTIGVVPMVRQYLITRCQAYLERGDLNVEVLGCGFASLDIGICDSLQQACAYVQTIEHRQGFKIACMEKIAFHDGWLNTEQLTKVGKALGKSGHGEYLL